MKLLGYLLMACLPLPPSTADAQEHGRVKWKRPTQAEADRMASESAITDSILRKGDIAVTDRGFFMFRGFLADGMTGDFVPVPNPMSKPQEVIPASEAHRHQNPKKGNQRQWLPGNP
jgi:hypothetical protein